MSDIIMVGENKKAGHSGKNKRYVIVNTSLRIWVFVQNVTACKKFLKNCHNLVDK